jgi:hypothetical protein
MTITEIRRRLVRIGAAARRGDLEAAHSDERALFVDVLTAVAIGKAGANEATAALESLSLDFKRRTA